jgi:hypothetical protein
MNIVKIENQSKTFIPIFTAVGLLTAIVHLIGGYLPHPATWGFQQLAFLPAVVRIAIPLLMVAFTIPAFQFYIRKWLNRLSDKFGRRSYTIKRSVAVLLTAGAILLFWLFRERFFLLGDGNLIIRIIHEQQLSNVDALAFPNEPLAGYVLIKLSKLIQKFIPALTYEAPIQIAVIIIGALSLFLAWKLVCTIVPDLTERLLLFGSFVLSGTLQILFGYIEAYIPLYCGIVIFLILSLRYLKGTSSLILSASAYGLLFCLHFGALIFFPALAFLFFHNYREQSGKYIPAAILSMLVVIVVILFLIGYPLQKFIALFTNSARHWLLNDASSGSAGDNLFSLHHAINILNFLILMGIFTSVSFFLMVKFTLRKNSDKARFLFLSIYGFMSMIFVFLFRSEIGMSRDWDILAVFYSGIIIAAGTYIVTCVNDAAICHRLMIMMIGITALQSVPYVLVNSNEVYARNRYEILPDGKLWPRSGMISAYEELSIYYRGMKEPRQALRYLSLLRNLDSTNPRIYHSIAHIYSLMNDKENEIAYLNQALRFSPNDWNACLKLGIAYGTNGQHDRAVYFLDKALELQPKSPEVNYYLAIAILNQTHECVQAVQFFTRTLELDPTYTDAYAGLAFCSAKRNDLISAREYKQKYLLSKPKNNPPPEILEMLNKIR